MTSLKQNRLMVALHFAYQASRNIEKCYINIKEKVSCLDSDDHSAYKSSLNQGRISLAASDFVALHHTIDALAYHYLSFVQ
jgi:hypothetical protein